MSNSNRFSLGLFLCSAVTVAGAQQPIAPDAKATAHNVRATAAPRPVSKSNGPTLEYTMEYIQDKLISRGALSYTVSLHDGAAAKDWSYDFVDKLSGTYANPSTCQIGFHWKQTRSGQAVTDKETYVDLTGGTNANVLTMDQYLTASVAKSGHDSWAAKVSPSLFVLHITKPDNHESNLAFPDEETANHLAKAMLHAAEMCASAQAAAAPAGDKDQF